MVLPAFFSFDPRRCRGKSNKKAYRRLSRLHKYYNIVQSVQRDITKSLPSPPPPLTTLAIKLIIKKSRFYIETFQFSLRLYCVFCLQHKPKSSWLQSKQCFFLFVSIFARAEYFCALLNLASSCRTKFDMHQCHALANIAWDLNQPDSSVSTLDCLGQCYSQSFLIDAKSCFVT